MSTPLLFKLNKIRVQLGPAQNPKNALKLHDQSEKLLKTNPLFAI